METMQVAKYTKIRNNGFKKNKMYSTHLLGLKARTMFLVSNNECGHEKYFLKWLTSYPSYDLSYMQYFPSNIQNNDYFPCH